MDSEIQFILLYNKLEDVYNACLNSVSRFSSAKVIEDNRDTNTVTISIGGGLFSKSEEISMKLDEITENQTKVSFIIIKAEKEKGIIPKVNKNVEKLKLVVKDLCPEPIMEDTVRKTEPIPNNNTMDNNTFNNDINDINNINNITNNPINNEVVNNNYEEVNNDPVNSMFNSNNQVEVKPISNAPSDSSKVKEGYDPLGDFMNKL